MLPDVSDLAKAIQLAMAPVFLLTGIAALRRRLTSVAITATTIAALLVSMLIAGLFVEVLLETPLQWLISAFFAASMVALVVGLAFFLREVHLAMRTVRITLQ